LLYDHFDINGYLNPSLWQWSTNSSGSGWTITNSLLNIDGGMTNGGGGLVLSQQLFTPNTDTLSLQIRARVNYADGGDWGLWGDGGESAALFALTIWATCKPRCIPIRARLRQITVPGIDVTTWHTYRIEMTGSTARFYVDGALKATHHSPSADGPALAGLVGSSLVGSESNDLSRLMLICGGQTARLLL